ncbi:MAG: cation transporter [Spirochaetia bacterium]|nr:cation transporter [Spirochaetia bacterium]
MSECDCEFEIKDKKSTKEKNVLFWLMGINASMFFVESIAGWFADSSGLIADSLDMFADAMVYVSTFYVIGKPLASKKRSAYFSGILQLVLGVGVFVDVIRRTFTGSEPHSFWMFSISLLALAANVICLMLLTKHKEGEIHMRATWIFTKNDVLANAGVIVAGALVYLLHSRIPDLAIGALIAAVIIKDSFKIFSEAWAA